MFSLFRFVALRHIFGKPVRTLLTVLGISCGIALFVGVHLINKSMLESFRADVQALAGKASLTIKAGEAGFPESQLELIEKAPGVRSAVPMVEARAYLTGAGSSETLMIFGVDLLREKHVRDYSTTDQQVIEDPLTFLNQPDSLIVSKPFAERHALRIDSTLDLSTALGVKHFTVRGILQPEGAAKAYGGSMAIMDIDGARMVFGKGDKFDRVDVITFDRADPAAVAEDLKKVLGSGYTVERPEAQSAGLERMVATFQKLADFLSLLALMVGLFLLGNTVTISVAERHKEIGTLRALGATKVGIFSLFVVEAFVMGGMGSFLGGLFGKVVAQRLVGTVTSSMSQEFLTQMSVPPLEFGVRDVLVTTLAGGAVAVLAAMWPARKAMSIAPIEAIRNGEESPTPQSFGWMYRCFMGGLVAFTLLVISSVLEWAARFPALEIFNQICIILGINLVAPLAVRWISLGMRSLTRRRGPTVVRLAVDNLLQNPKRTASNVMTLMLGLVLVIIISSLNVSLNVSVDDWLSKSLTADLTVSSGGNIAAFQTQSLDEAIKGELEALPALRTTLQHPIETMRFVHLNFQGQAVAVKAYDEPTSYDHFDIRERSAAEAGRELFRGAQPAVFISPTFASRFKKKFGDTLQFETPFGPLAFRVVGTVTDFSSNQGIVYMDRKVYKQAWHDPLVNFLTIKLKPGTDVESIRRTIDSAFGRAKELTLSLNSEIKGQALAAVDRGFAYSRVIEFAALAIALLGLLNTLFVSLLERTREIGLLRAVGMSREQVFAMIFLEAVLQGCAAVILSVFLGTAVSYIWIRYSMANTLGWILPFHFPTSSIEYAVVCGIAVSVLAGILPSRRATRLEIKEALAYE